MKLNDRQHITIQGGKHMKKALSFFLAILMIFGSFAGAIHVIATADGTALTENGFVYEIVDGNAIITDYLDLSFTGQIEIPVKLGGYPVTEIGREAFRGSQCTSVMISSGLEKIHPEAFAYDMPNLEAYYTNPLANSSNSDFYANDGILYQTVYGFSMIFAYPKNKPEKTYEISGGYVMGVSDFAFCEVENIEEVTITGIQFSGVGNYAFYGAKNLKKITVDNCIAIGEKAFANCEKLDDIGVDLDKGLYFSAPMRLKTPLSQTIYQIMTQTAFSITTIISSPLCPNMTVNITQSKRAQTLLQAAHLIGIRLKRFISRAALSI